MTYSVTVWYMDVLPGSAFCVRSYLYPKIKKHKKVKTFKENLGFSSLVHVIAVKISIRKLLLHASFLLLYLFTYWLYCVWIAELLNDPEVAKRVLHTEDHKECLRLTDGISEVEWSNSVRSVIRKGNFAKVWTCGIIIITFHLGLERYWHWVIGCWAIFAGIG